MKLSSHAVLAATAAGLGRLLLLPSPSSAALPGEIQPSVMWCPENYCRRSADMYRPASDSDSDSSANSATSTNSNSDLDADADGTATPAVKGRISRPQSLFNDCYDPISKMAVDEIWTGGGGDDDASTATQEDGDGAPLSSLPQRTPPLPLTPTPSPTTFVSTLGGWVENPPDCVEVDPVAEKIAEVDGSSSFPDPPDTASPPPDDPCPVGGDYCFCWSKSWTQPNERACPEWMRTRYGSRAETMCPTLPHPCFVSIYNNLKFTGDGCNSQPYFLLQAGYIGKEGWEVEFLWEEGELMSLPDCSEVAGNTYAPTVSYAPSVSPTEAPGGGTSSAHVGRFASTRNWVGLVALAWSVAHFF